MAPIAEIKLAPGEAGYYDEYSRIYLSSTSPRAVIYPGVNCTQIKRSIRSGRLILVSGGFDVPPKQEENKVKITPVITPDPVVEVAVNEQEEAKPVEPEVVIQSSETEEGQTEVVTEEVTEETSVTEEVKEETVESVEEPVVKKSPRKRKNSKAEVAE